MWKDPIVQEVREAGEYLIKQANNDLHVFFQNLRNNEKRHKYKIISKLPKRSISKNTHNV